MAPKSVQKVGRAPPAPRRSTKSKGKPKSKVTKVSVNYAAIARRYSEVDRQKVASRIRSILDGSRPVMGAVRRALVKTLTAMSPSSGHVGPADMSDDVMTIVGSPRDIPVMPLTGYQFLERKCRVTKIASSGSSAGGWYAELIATDLKEFTTSHFRIKSITSWTAVTCSTHESQYASLSTPASNSSTGTEAMPSWNEDFTRVGSGYAGITIKYPLGDFLMYVDSDPSLIATHYTSLGGDGNVTGIPVVFDCILEVLV